ncbi:MAG: hypothetical protein FWH01_08135 [Oscillospiraceae bacterium]|nr:hypothetical protein [Oscillospiraceae bacterium]
MVNINDECEKYATGDAGVCLAFGMFDGVHIGHKRIIETLMDTARAYNMKATLLKIDFTSDTALGAQLRLTAGDEAERLIQRIAPVTVVNYTFAGAEMKLAPEQFIKTCLIDKLRANIVVAGENCKFGKDGAGTIHILRELAGTYGYKLLTVNEQKVAESCAYDDGIVSALGGEEGAFRNGIVNAAAIKKALCDKNISRANAMLGQPYALSGTVTRGRALGRRSNMPTANLKTHPRKFIPAHGVYATVTRIGESDSYFGLTHIGKKPSVDTSGEITIETHLLDFTGDLYGQHINTELHMYIRDTMKFDGVDAVKAQVDRDTIVARKYFRQLATSPKSLFR